MHRGQSSEILYVIRKLRRYLWTARYLTLRQIVFRLLRHIHPHLLPPKVVRNDQCHRAVQFSVDEIPVSWEGLRRCSETTRATFLNLERWFRKRVDWSYPDHGLLWNYHLHYLNWVNQPDGGVESLFGEYQKNGYGVGSSLDPYPTALRIVNIVKAIATGRIVSNLRICILIRHDCINLLKTTEYHLG